jgi:hypothetical protein
MEIPLAVSYTEGAMKRARTHLDEPLTDASGEVRELRAADRAGFRPAREILPSDFFVRLRAARAERGRDPHQFGAGRISPTRSPA